MARGDLSDSELRIVEPLLPTERGRKSRPYHDNRRFFNRMLHILRVGCPWRDMHERYGKWNWSMFVSAAGPNKVFGMHFWKRLSNLD
ncbi:transposase [Agrobacterium tumefaciens]|uniref:transposase n=1 Tax=Agrobacterium tumefaciens TaxID=358 RepID=UPI001F167BFE